MSEQKRFSERFGYTPPNVEITVRYDAPYELRGVILEIAYEAGLGPNALRGLVCRVLRARPDSSNWSNSNIEREVENLVDQCEWFEVYDIIEEIYKLLQRDEYSLSRDIFVEADTLQADPFMHEINQYFYRKGIGWQLLGSV